MMDLDLVNEKYTNSNYWNSFALEMNNEEVFFRIGRPCYGELRKYESTHRGDCTQPKNSKPGDLTGNNFPDGTPTSLALYRGGFNVPREVQDFLFSDESPWVRGFGGSSNVENHDKFVLLKDTEFDPTVLVNLLKSLQNSQWHGQPSNLKNMEDLKKAYLINMLSNGNIMPRAWYGFNTYFVAPNFSMKRYFNQNPMDVTGGTLKDRVDYNRSELHMTFYTDKSMGGLSKISTTMFQKFTDPKDCVKIWSDLIDQTLDEERDPVDVPYYWETTSGRTNRPAEQKVA